MDFLYLAALTLYPSIVLVHSQGIDFSSQLKCIAPGQEAGGCTDGSASSTRWSYNVFNNQCESFTYSGCNGNENNFMSQSECTSACGNMMQGFEAMLSNTPPQEGPSSSQSTNQRPQQSNPSPPGRQRPRRPRDPRVPPRDTQPPQPPQPPRRRPTPPPPGRLPTDPRLPPGRSPPRTRLPTDIRCIMPPVNPNPLQCTGQAEERWRFNLVLGQCERFDNRGCRNNRNNFESAVQCRRTCGQTALGVCRLPHARAGPCRAAFPRWSYNSQSGECVRFIYGGCQGNNNRFESEDECRSRCGRQGPPPRNVCRLQHSETGPCRANFRRWSYNSDTRECVPFRYGGCQGNNNRFQTEEECQLRCGQTGPPSDNICRLPHSVVGPCEALIQSWSFNSATGRCVRFNYGGCRGNENRFNTIQECERRCGGSNPPTGQICELPHSTTGDCGSSVSMWSYSSQTRRCVAFVYRGCRGNRNRFNSRQECQQRCQPIDRTICRLPHAQSGNCLGSSQRWTYNSATGRCVSFIYGGCGGSRNRFRTAEECDSTCRSTEDICRLPYAQAGNCRAFVPSWTFNYDRNRCQRFTYGGCGGNANRFSTMRECQRSCRPPSTGPGTGNQDNVCSLPRVRGPCRGRIRRWGFNSATGRCQQFTFGGCRGNRNNFRSRRQCQSRCSASNVPRNCQLPRVQGRCLAFLRRWYFNPTRGRCEMFIYGGCGGNANNFTSRNQCQRSCRPRQRRNRRQRA